MTSIPTPLPPLPFPPPSTTAFSALSIQINEIMHYKSGHHHHHHHHRLNARSVGKPEKGKEISIISDIDIDIHCLTESWLRTHGAEAKGADPTHSGYSIRSPPPPPPAPPPPPPEWWPGRHLQRHVASPLNRDGGLAVIYRDMWPLLSTGMVAWPSSTETCGLSSQPGWWPGRHLQRHVASPLNRDGGLAVIYRDMWPLLSTGMVGLSSSTETCGLSLSTGMVAWPSSTETASPLNRDGGLAVIYRDSLSSQLTASRRFSFDHSSFELA